eukprot:gb/GEZN01003458.1/.p1 GENE.gb/GEZN01003458.1/~~gb/GEZN01003458.1/.p1  ORF type:complete len:331 (-),score=19.09 gb/GEZN01003458.1/:1123-2115(-)
MGITASLGVQVWPCSSAQLVVQPWQAHWEEFRDNKLDRQRIQGYVPEITGKFPVYIWLTGTDMGFHTETDDDLTFRMASQGFVSAQCEYNNDLYPLIRDCKELERKAENIFNAKDKNSCISVVCTQPKANCSSGVAVHGFSQGANLISLAKHYAPQVSASYEQGNGDAPFPTDDLSKCLDYYLADGSRNPFKALDSSRTISIVGENDEFFGCCYECPCDRCCHRTTGHVFVQQTKTTGRHCSEGTYDCRSQDGSGWYIVSKAESGKVDGADHCYAYQAGECLARKNNAWNPAYLKDCPWCLNNTLSWLAKTAVQGVLQLSTSELTVMVAK